MHACAQHGRQDQRRACVRARTSRIVIRLIANYSARRCASVVNGRQCSRRTVYTYGNRIPHRSVRSNRKMRAHEYDAYICAFDDVCWAAAATTYNDFINRIIRRPGQWRGHCCVLLNRVSRKAIVNKSFRTAAPRRS